MRYLLLGLFLTSPLFAAIHLKTELDTGKKQYSPSVTVNDGAWADLQQDDVLLRVSAEPVDEDAVKIRTEIARLKGTEITLLGKPALITKWNEAAEIQVEEEDGSLRYRLRITPTSLP